MSDSDALTIRSWQYRDLEKIASVSLQMQSGLDTTQYGTRLEFREQLQYVRQWYGPLKCLQLFPNPLQHFFSAYVAEQGDRLSGFIQVSPFNSTHTTWRVERIATATHSHRMATIESGELGESGRSLRSIDPASTRVTNPHPTAPASSKNGATAHNPEPGSPIPHDLDPSPSSRTSIVTPLATDVASQLLRHCLDNLWEARTWITEVDTTDTTDLALYRHHGFQPLAQVTYWAIAPDLLHTLAEPTPATLNLRPVSNADAGLLHQLDTVAMPPLVRQVFDRHVADFCTSLPEASLLSLHHMMVPQETVSSYVFEPQRKAAIGYFQLQLCQNGSQPHTAKLTVHPAYTWLYPELLIQMARIAQKYPSQSLQLTSSDYQAEREEYLSKVGAVRTQHTLLMSRSVWHKVRETKPVSLETLQLSDMLKGWQPGQKPIPGRFSFDSHHSPSPSENSESSPPKQ
ncbi:MAG: GNAT family N-acetyltransferase [Leptolyngbyaceae cyanobacterium]